MAEQGPARVAIIGGGCAAMAAAFELTRPHLAGRFEVSVYQVGWRLGGKGASGRGPAARIEEHGLHLWMGFYENAFRLMRECYAELQRDPTTCPIADWRDAFTPAPLIGVADVLPTGEWQIWEGALPPTSGLPGDPGPVRWTVAEYMVRSVALVRNLLETMRPGLAAAAAGPGSGDEPGALANRIMRLLRIGELATVAGFTQAVSALEMVIGSLSQYPQNVVLALLEGIARSAREVLEQSLTQEVPLRRVWHVIDLTLATLRGMVRFGIASDPRGFDAIDEYDCREWLLLCGASEAAVNSAWVRALYDLGFSYEDADVTRPRIAAGQALRSMLRAFFTYRGSFFWRMQAGMGDIVFAPFYEVLRRRGVRFHFFHRLRQLRLAAAETLAPGELPFVERLEFEEQARIRDGRDYEPLVDVDGLPCWPSAPRWEQLEQGDALRGRDFESHWDEGGTAKTLRVGEDFDFVVLAVGLGAVPHVCADLVARDARWRAMVDHVKTVATQAFQVWLREDMAALGRPGAPLNVSGFVEPFDTWADMAHLIPRERWPVPPRALAYFCSVLDDGDVASAAQAAAQHERVRENAVRFLERDIGHLWPGAVRSDGGFRWDLLVDPRGAAPDPETAARFATQFWTASVNPSDRYVLSLPGSTAYRISPLDQSCDNLTVAGDWTACGFNAGCVEAAVMSGRLAAHALAQSPALDEIVGYDHP